tara:strand:+ start:473 stop:676 length:204 start_codon:yes stop_codon:yes gene_type:complete
MSCVFPGLPEVLASLLLLVMQLIKDDLPTLDLPMKAYSGKFGFGHFSHSVLLQIKLAFVISILYLLV